MSAYQIFTHRHLTKTDFVYTILLFAFSTILICAFNFRNISFAFARFDDLALIAAASDPPHTWFTEGFSKYFQVYPEFSIVTTNFIRPVANGLFWLFSGFGLDQRLHLIVTSYAMHALNTSCIFLFVRSRGASILRAAFLSMSFLLTATFWYSQSLLYPAFAPDQIVLTFLIIAILAIYLDMVGLALLACLLAVLTKETALPVLVAIGLYGLYARRIVYIIIGALVIAGYFGLRYAAFSSATTGIYVAVSLDNPRLFSIERLFASLPIGPPKMPLVALDQADLFAAIGGAYFFANSVIWIVVLAAVLKSDIRNALIFHISKRDSHGRMLLLLFASFAASYGYFYMVSSLESLRFGYVAMWLLTIGFAVFHMSTLVRLAVPMIFIGNLTVTGFALYQNERNATLRGLIAEGSQALISFLSTRDDVTPIYVVNDFSTAFTRTSDLARLAGRKLNLQRGSSIDIEKCNHEEWKRIETRLDKISDDHIRITSYFPDCVKIRFESSSNLKMQALSVGNRIIRNANIQYEFYRDDRPIAYLNSERETANHMVIELRNAKAIYFDFAERVWRMAE